MHPTQIVRRRVQARSSAQGLASAARCESSVNRDQLDLHPLPSPVSCVLSSYIHTAVRNIIPNFVMMHPAIQLPAPHFSRCSDRARLPAELLMFVNELAPIF